MYLTARSVRALSGRMGDLIEAATAVTGLLNDRVGADYALSMQIGGNPDLLTASASWETLGAYQAAREAYLADGELLGAITGMGELSAETSDLIARVLAAPGERSAFTSLSTANMHMPQIAQAIPFGLEVCEFVESKTGVKVGFVHATTGDRSMVGWVSRFDSLDQMAESNEALEADPEYLDLFKRGDNLFVDGSLEQNIHQLIV